MEAIARAFGLLESAAVEEALLHLFRVMVDRTLFIRGRLAAAEVYGGLPPGASRQAQKMEEQRRAATATQSPGRDGLR